jgi:transposase
MIVGEGKTGNAPRQKRRTGNERVRDIPTSRSFLTCDLATSQCWLGCSFLNVFVGGLCQNSLFSSACSWFRSSRLVLKQFHSKLSGANLMPLPNARDLTELQWAILDPLIPEPPRRKDGRGRPWKGRRSVLSGILWVLRTGAPWADLPERFPSYQTCHRRFQHWVRSGIMRGVLEALAEDLRIHGRLDVREAFIDGSFAPAKKGDRRLARRNVARERRSWPWRTATVFRWLCPLKVLRPMK